MTGYFLCYTLFCKIQVLCSLTTWYVICTVDKTRPRDCCNTSMWPANPAGKQQCFMFRFHNTAIMGCEYRSIHKFSGALFPERTISG